MELLKFIKTKVSSMLEKPVERHQMTEEEIIEYNKCKEDVIYFIEKYCVYKRVDKLDNIKLTEQQKTYITNILNKE